jgi:(S)-2-hydroxy-acid oxidase
MAHRGETLHNEVSCIADLKALGSSKLPKMVRGEQIQSVRGTRTLTNLHKDYYNEGSMDLITYVSSRLTRINQLNVP